MKKEKDIVGLMELTDYWPFKMAIQENYSLRKFLDKELTKINVDIIEDYENMSFAEMQERYTFDFKYRHPKRKIEFVNLLNVFEDYKLERKDATLIILTSSKEEASKLYDLLTEDEKRSNYIIFNLLIAEFCM